MIGDGFQNGMAEQVELEKVGRRHLPAPPVRNRSKRAHKIKMTSSATVVNTYSKDGNGCSHDDPSQWNEERSIYYWEEKISKRYYVNNKMGFGLDYNMHYTQERCPGRVYLIGRLCKILNGRGQISSACAGLVGERMCEKPQVSSLVKMFSSRVVIGL